MDDAATIPGHAAGASDDGAKPLDLRGLKCPMPVLRARKALRHLSVGGTLRVLTTDPLAAIDIPHLVNEDGHHLAEMAQGGDGSTLFVIVKLAR